MNYNSDDSGNSRLNAGGSNSNINICALSATLITSSDYKLNFHMHTQVCVHYSFSSGDLIIYIRYKK